MIFDFHSFSWGFRATYLLLRWLLSVRGWVVAGGDGPGIFDRFINDPGAKNALRKTHDMSFA